MDSGKVAIIGMGYVGKAMLTIFPDAEKYDSKWFAGSRSDTPVVVSGMDGNSNVSTQSRWRDHIGRCELAVICVPTPSATDGTCDTSAVDEVVRWLQTPLILIKSAVCPGTTDRLRKETGKRIVVSPEYIGESRYYIPDRYLDPTNPLKHEFLILGGADADCGAVADIFAPRVGPACRIRVMAAVEAELIKYAENAFFATKVGFANELRDICEAYGALWHRVREGWIDDPRVGPMHTAVFPKDRGFGGKCYPKDLAALAQSAKVRKVGVPILEGVLASNRLRRAEKS